MFIELRTTAPNIEISNLIAAKLVEEKLATCVQVSGPIISHYVWEGKQQLSEEYILLIKTKSDLMDRIMKSVKEIHPYEVPEFIATEIASINPSYTDWMNTQLS